MNAQHICISGRFTGMTTLMDPDYLRHATAQRSAAAISSAEDRATKLASGLVLTALASCISLAAVTCFI